MSIQRHEFDLWLPRRAEIYLCLLPYEHVQLQYEKFVGPHQFQFRHRRNHLRKSVRHIEKFESS